MTGIINEGSTESVISNLISIYSGISVLLLLERPYLISFFFFRLIDVGCLILLPAFFLAFLVEFQPWIQLPFL